MPELSLAELTQAAADAMEPRFVATRPPKIGGVDPLGLRQINFGLMDQVLPGINNVGRHVRPYVVTTWAWRRAAVCARQAGRSTVPVDELKDFVDRVEVLYAWSHFLHEGGADLPGRDVLNSLLRKATYRFGGTEWRDRRKARAQSTAFTAAITYGPAMRTLGWLEPDPDLSGAMRASPAPAVQAALDAFEAQIIDRLTHSAFSVLGVVDASTEEVRAWRDGWALDAPTAAERRAMALALAGPSASRERSAGVSLMVAAAATAAGPDLKLLRRTMCGSPTNFLPEGDVEQAWTAWRRMQVRQAFRLALEALFHWMTGVLEGGPRSSTGLVRVFLSQVPDREGAVSAGAWLANTELRTPTDAMDAIDATMAAPGEAGLAAAIANALAFCIREAPLEPEAFERADRLPLARARREALVRTDEPAAAFLQHVFESWILAQHVYWSVGRGLADARARGKTLLRLRIVLEEAGWTLTPGVGRGAPPIATPDRLRTAVSLARESGLMGIPADGT
ncbi:hypothetical protein [Muricoccus vinaceus]|uniref:Septum formation inhibitor-activating ATPase n=1 Tax=Muricoccus vinaceus TaxID=424704 RepID=A0ABV6ITD7_9PROT